MVCAVAEHTTVENTSRLEPSLGELKKVEHAEIVDWGVLGHWAVLLVQCEITSLPPQDLR
eukprot:4020453-Pyramimonas_sp.AAC.1